MKYILTLLVFFSLFCKAQIDEKVNQFTDDELLYIVGSSGNSGILGIYTDQEQIEQSSITCESFCKLPKMTIAAAGFGFGAGDNVIWLAIPCTQEKSCNYMRDYLNALKQEGWYQPTKQVYVFSKLGQEEFPIAIGEGLCYTDSNGSSGRRVFWNPAPRGFEVIRVETGFHEAHRICAETFRYLNKNSNLSQIRQSIDEIVPHLNPPRHVNFSDNAGMRVLQHMTTSASDYANVSTGIELEGISVTELVLSFETQLGETGWQKINEGSFSLSANTEWQFTDTKGAIWMAVLTINGDVNQMAKSVQWFITLISNGEPFK